MPLDLVNGGISDFTSPEKHHIFPQAFLKSHGSGEAELHALPNFCFLPAELNKRILDARPSEYFRQFRCENDQFDDAAKSHLIPVGADSGIGEDDYLQFLKARSDIMMQEIDRLTGVSTAPAVDQRQRTIERLETQIRDLINSTLVVAHGEGYWKSAVPEDVRTEAEKRMESELRKHPELPRDGFGDPRQRLNYLNVADYLKVIEVKSNWPYFETVFRRRQDLERHFEAFSDFRNALMHNRPVTEIQRRSGELAIIWLNTVLPSENGQTGPAPVEDQDE